MKECENCRKRAKNLTRELITIRKKYIKMNLCEKCHLFLLWVIIEKFSKTS